METSDEKIVIEGMKQSFVEVSNLHEAHLNTIKVLRDITKLMFTTASLFITLIISLNAFFVEVGSNFQSRYNTFLIVLLMVFLLFLVLTIWNLIPRSYTRPFPRDYKLITDSLCVPESDRYAVLITQYLESMKKNKSYIDAITLRLVASGVLYFLLVMIIIGLAMIPKV